MKTADQLKKHDKALKIFLALSAEHQKSIDMIAKQISVLNQRLKKLENVN